MKIIVCYTPTDKDLFANTRIVRFALDTEHQIEPYCESLGSTVTSLVVDTEKPEPMEEAMRLSTDSLTALYNTLSGDEPKVGKPRIRADGVRRLYDRIVGLAKTTEPMIWNSQPTIIDRDEHTAEMIKHADCFMVAAFRGQPKGFDTKKTKTLDEARKVAVGMYLDRPLAIYAVRGNRQVHVENFDPTEKKMDDETNVTDIAPTKRGRKPKGEAATKTERTPRAPRTIGEFKQIREGSSLHRILVAASHGDKTVDQIAEYAGVRPDQASHRLRHVLGVNHGIDYAKDEGGVISLVLPHGVTLVDAVKAKAVAAAKETQEAA